jgi:UDP-4-amino-4,6-dideoxy-N-acetyl-beta-L-altrosamine N-acetyltransferase
MTDNETRPRLIEMHREHLADVLAWRNAPEVRNNMYTYHVISNAEHARWFESCNKDESRLNCLALDANEEPIGVVNFGQIDLRSKTSFWGYYERPGVPKGSALLIEFLVCHFVFEEWKFHKLNCEVLEFNKAVFNMHIKAGFKNEGAFRQHYWREGVYYDVFRLGMLADEWAQSKAKIIERLTKIGCLSEGSF